MKRIRARCQVKSFAETNTLRVEGIACKPSYPESLDFSASGWSETPNIDLAIENDHVTAYEVSLFSAL